MVKGGDFLGEYGPESSSGKRSTCGGDMTGKVKPLPYSMPVGPKNMNSPGPGLKGGTNMGTCGTQGKR